MSDPRPLSPARPVTDITGWSEDEILAMDVADDEDGIRHAARLEEWEARQADAPETGINQGEIVNARALTRREGRIFRRLSL